MSWLLYTKAGNKPRLYFADYNEKMEQKEITFKVSVTVSWVYTEKHPTDKQLKLKALLQ